MQQCDVLLTRATQAGIRTAPAAEHPHELPYLNDEMDGATVLGEQVARPCPQDPPDVRDENAAGEGDAKRKVSWRTG